MKLTSPSRWLVVFTLAVLIPSVVLVALGIQALRDESLIIEKKIEDEDRQRAEGIRESLKGIIIRGEERLRTILAESRGDLEKLIGELRRMPVGPPDFFLVSRKGKILFPSARPLYRSEESGKPLVSPLVSPLLARARRLEFREKNYPLAAGMFEKVFQEGDNDIVRAEGLMGSARCRFKAGETDQAGVIYRQIVSLYPALLNSAGFPYALTARYENSKVLEKLGRSSDSLNEIISAYRELVNGRWELGEEKYLYLSRMLLEGLGSIAGGEASIPAAVKDEEISRLKITPVVNTLRSHLPELLSGGSGIIARSSETLLYYPVPGGEEGITGLVIFLPELITGYFASLPEPAGGDDAVALVVNEDGETVGFGELAAPGKPGVTLSLGKYFPGLKVEIYHRDPEALAALVRLRRRIYAGLLIPIFLIILLGLYFLWTGVKRERKLARLKADFVSTVTHELKTPLTAIRMFGETLEMGRVESPKQRKKYYELISRESDKLSQMIDNILDFSRMEAGRREYNFKPSDLSRVVSETVAAYGYYLESEGNRIRVELPEEPVEVKIDKDAISQAVLNLLSNAVKFSPPDRPIMVRLSPRGADAIIEVEDRGVGIALEETEKIFQRFYRSGDSMTRKIRGTGLGLAIVRHIVRSHGGEVKVKSEKGKGSTFSIILPII
jgi:signal transduction histidine kinase